jgi:rfaE bifunctional protein kinase chain/domain
LRIDEEDEGTISAKETELLLSAVRKQVNANPVDVIIFEDYDKGVLHQGVIKNIINLANENNIPVVVDPKKRNFMNYSDVSLFKPNLHELKTGLKSDIDEINAGELEKLASVFRKEKNIEMILVTLSEHGIFYSAKNEYGIIPAHAREIADVSGAGDTVVTVAAMCLAAGMNPQQIAALSNLAGGMVCEHVGVVPVKKSQLEKEASKLNVEWEIKETMVSSKRQ